MGDGCCVRAGKGAGKGAGWVQGGCRVGTCVLSVQCVLSIDACHLLIGCAPTVRRAMIEQNTLFQVPAGDSANTSQPWMEDIA
jgi:hypothetical protein